MSRVHSAFMLGCWLCAVLVATAASAQTPHPAGHEFQVNTYTTKTQDRPVVTMNDSGRFVIVWQSFQQDGHYEGVFARRYDAAGTALGTELQVNTFTTNGQIAPVVGIDGSSGFVVAWTSGGQDGPNAGVFARRFDSAGVALGVEFQVNSHTEGAQINPAIAVSPGGDFVVVWQSIGQDQDGYGVFGRAFTSSGGGLGSEFAINAHTLAAQTYPAIAIDSQGDFVVVWASNNQDGAAYGIFGRRFGSGGAALATEFQVNVYTSMLQNFPSVSADGDGDFVVAWRSLVQDGSGPGVFARRFDSAGASAGGEFQVNTYTPGNQLAPVVAVASDGGFVVAWEELGQDDNGYGIRAQAFESAGIPVGGEFQVNAFTEGFQRHPAAASSAGGHFVVAWDSVNQDYSYVGVFARRFSFIAALDIDGDGTVLPLTDGLLILRFTFGFTGTTLVNGAVGGGCTRCDAAAIFPYLGALGLVLDADGTGSVQPLTDGLLILRFVFGFSGTTLASGAVGMGCTRCDGPMIAAYLQPLT